LGYSTSKLAKTKSVNISDAKLLTAGILTSFILSRRQGTSQRTITFYQEKLSKAIGIELSAEGINSFLARLSCGNGKRNYYAAVRALVNWLYHTGWLKSNPMGNVAMPKVARKILPSIKVEDIPKLLAKCKCQRDKVVVQLLWTSGMRLSELTQVTNHNIDWSNQTIMVIAKGNKEVRYAFKDADGLIRDYFTDNQELKLNANGIKSLLKRLGVDSGIHCNPHSFRRGFAINCVKQGLPTIVVKALGNWDSLFMVERYTANLSFDEALKAYNQVTS